MAEDVPALLEELGHHTHWIYKDQVTDKIYLFMVQGEEDGHSGDQTGFIKVFDTEAEALAYLEGTEDAMSATDFQLRPFPRGDYEKLTADTADEDNGEEDEESAARVEEFERVTQELVTHGEATYEGNSIRAVAHGYTVTGHDHYHHVEEAMAAIDKGEV